MANDSTVAGYLTPTSTAPAEDASLDAIFQALFVGLSGLAGNLVRPRWQPVAPKEPEPSTNWCAIGVTAITPDDNPAVIHNPFDASGLGSDTLYRHTLIEVLASFYGPQGETLAEQSRDGLWLAQNNGALAPYAIAFTGLADPIRSVPELVNQQWRRRYDFAARFRRQIVRTYGVRTLVAAEIDLYTEQGEIASAVVDPQP
jgi:hypothetical protein